MQKQYGGCKASFIFISNLFAYEKYCCLLRFQHRGT